MANPSKISLTGALKGSPVPLPFFLSSDNVTPATDMSAAMRTPWIAKSAAQMSLWLTWTATGSPNGTFSVEVTNDPTAATGIAVPAAYLPGIAAGQPGGTAGRMVIDPIQTSAVFLAVVYTPSSGGSGAVATAIMGF